MSFVYHDRDDSPPNYWPPRRADGTPEAAHAATPLLSDDQDAWEPVPWTELIRFVAPFVIGVAAVVALALYGWR